MLFCDQPQKDGSLKLKEVKIKSSPSAKKTDVKLSNSKENMTVIITIIFFLSR